MAIEIKWPRKKKKNGTGSEINPLCYITFFSYDWLVISIVVVFKFLCL